MLAHTQCNLSELTGSFSNGSTQDRRHSHVIISNAFPSEQCAGNISVNCHVVGKLAHLNVVPSQLAAVHVIGDCMRPSRGDLHYVSRSLLNGKH